MSFIIFFKVNLIKHKKRGNKLPLFNNRSSGLVRDSGKLNKLK